VEKKHVMDGWDVGTTVEGRNPHQLGCINLVDLNWRSISSINSMFANFFLTL